MTGRGGARCCPTTSIDSGCRPRGGAPHMASAERTITINRPVDEVFTFVADGRNARQWRSGVLDVDLVSGSGLGARYSQRVRGPGGRRIPADYEITAFEPNRKIGFRATAGPVRPEGSFTFEGIGTGTILTF